MNKLSNKHYYHWECLSYDDVQIIPKYSETKHREDCDISTRFTKNTILTIPIVSSPMDTITEYKMAKEMLEWGGVGVIHRFMSIEDQAKMMFKVHSIWDSYFDISVSMGGKDIERTADTEWVAWRKSIIGNTITKSDDNIFELFCSGDSILSLDLVHLILLFRWQLLSSIAMNIASRSRARYSLRIPSVRGEQRARARGYVHSKFRRNHRTQLAS